MESSDCIPPEICMQILSHLPVKSLIRFRSVSKKWKSIISSPDFASQHLSCYSNNRLEPPLIVLERFHQLCPDAVSRAQWFSSCFPTSPYYQQTSEFDFSVPAESLLGNLPSEVVGAVNGLLLVQTNSDGVLWNPSIRKCLPIPRPPPSSSSSSSSNLDLCLGFDYLTHDYKVVNNLHHEQYPALEIFSLTSCLWRRAESFQSKVTMSISYPNRWKSIKKSRKMSFQGSLYWVWMDWEFYKVFMSFNLMSETFSSIPLPNNPSPPDVYSVETPVVVAGEFPGLLISCNGTSDIWLLEMDGSWSKRSTLDNVDVYDSSLLYHSKDGVLIWVSLGDGDRTMYALDINTGKRSVVSQSQFWDPLYFGPFIESLALLN